MPFGISLLLACGLAQLQRSVPGCAEGADVLMGGAVGDKYSRQWILLAIQRQSVWCLSPLGLCVQQNDNLPAQEPEAPSAEAVVPSVSEDAVVPRDVNNMPSAKRGRHL